MRLYDDLVPWYHLLDPTEAHRDEVAAFTAALLDVCPRAETLLEIGAGAGNNAFFLRQRFRCTLSDIAEPMLDLSRIRNPDCTHVQGDMRTLRVGRTFDAVLVHDAIMYMASRDDLRAAIETAFAHTRPGGAALFAPDCVRETFQDETVVIEADDPPQPNGQPGPRGLRALEWSRDPHPDDDVYLVDYALLLREGTEVRAVHDHHIEGVFPRQFWFDTLESVGFRAETIPRPIGDGTFDEVFICRRP